jgi:hypothetical protein
MIVPKVQKRSKILPCVLCPDSVPRLQNLHWQLCGWLASLLLCKLHEQAKSVPIAGNGVRAGLSLAPQAIGEKGWQEV